MGKTPVFSVHALCSLGVFGQQKDFCALQKCSAKGRFPSLEKKSHFPSCLGQEWFRCQQAASVSSSPSNSITPSEAGSPPLRSLTFPVICVSAGGDVLRASACARAQPRCKLSLGVVHARDNFGSGLFFFFSSVLANNEQTVSTPYSLQQPGLEASLRRFRHKLAAVSTTAPT